MKYIIAIIFVLWIVNKYFPKSPRKAKRSRSENFNEESLALTLKVSSPVDTKSNKTNGENVTPTKQEYFQDIGRDNFEGYFGDSQESYTVGAKLFINYTDGNNNNTERMVSVKSIGVLNGNYILIGTCHLRNATRTFLTKRISMCVDEDTGEIIKDVPKFLLDKYEKSPQKSCDELLHKDHGFLKCLLYVGKADGQLRAPERHIICEALRKISGDDRITEEMSNELISDIYIPSIHAFKIAVGKIAKANTETLKTLLLYSEKIVRTQKTVHPSEEEALKYIGKFLKEDHPVVSSTH